MIWSLIPKTLKITSFPPLPQKSIYTALSLGNCVYPTVCDDYRFALFTGLAPPDSFLILAFFFLGGAGLDDDDLLLLLEADVPIRCRRFRSVTMIKSLLDLLWDRIPWLRHLLFQIIKIESNSKSWVRQNVACETRTVDGEKHFRTNKYWFKGMFSAFDAQSHWKMGNKENNEETYYGTYQSCAISLSWRCFNNDS